MDYAARQAALRTRMHAAGFDGVLICHLPSVRYLCGFSGSNGLLLLKPRGARLFTDGRYREQAGEEVRAARVTIPAKGDLWGAAAGECADLKAVALEEDYVTLAQRRRLLRAWSGGGQRLRTITGWIEAQRAVKDREEIAVIRRAVNLASSVFLPTLAHVRPGMAETAVAGRLEFALREAGGEGLAFDTIVAAGKRSALIHGRPSAARLPRRGFVVFDYGVILGGYMSDMTRTAFLGRPDRRARAVYDTVLEAQQAGIAAVRAGVSCAEVDEAARAVIRKAGWGKQFPHSTGHGVGLEIHEHPRLAATSRETLTAGEVITIEPGVYLPGWGGVRIEDMVVVTASGCEVLTPTPKELITL